MSQYYNLEKTAEILSLSTGDVNRLREQGKISGYRDGMNWKFKKEEVENFLTDRIKDGSQKQSQDDSSDDDLFTLDNEAQGFDLGAGDDGLFTLSDDELASVGSEPNSAKSGVDLAGASGLSLSKASSSDLKLSGDSGLSLDLDDDDDLRLDSGGSGLSLLDEMGDSSEEAGPNDFVLGGPSPSSDSKLSLTGNSSLSLADDDEDFKLVDEDTETPPINLKKQSDPEPAIVPAEDVTFQLEDENDNSDNLYAIKEETAQPAAFAQPVAGSTDDDDFASLLEDPQAPKEEESFQLSPSVGPTDESDSESASQLIPVEEETLFLSEDNPDDSTTYDTATPDGGAIPSSFGESSDSDPFANAELSSDSTVDNPFGEVPEDGSNSSDVPFTPLDSDSPSEDLKLDTQVPSELPVSAMPSVGCAYKAGKDCACESTYTGLNILLILVPCLLILIPSAMAVYELIRSIWSWGEPYQLTGTILDTLANLLNLR